MEALSSKEREFAAENNGLIYSFLNYYRLPEAEHYDICAIAYLQAVKEWHRKPELRDKYKFSTIAFKKMESAKIKKYHADRLRDAYIIFSLNDLNAEGNEYLGQLADQRDVIREIEAKQNIKDLLSEVMPALTERQRKHLPIPPVSKKEKVTSPCCLRYPSTQCPSFLLHYVCSLSTGCLLCLLTYG